MHYTDFWACAMFLFETSSLELLFTLMMQTAELVLKVKYFWDVQN